MQRNHFCGAAVENLSDWLGLKYCGFFSEWSLPEVSNKSVLPNYLSGHCMMHQPQGLHPILWVPLGEDSSSSWTSGLLPTEVKSICPFSVPSSCTGFTLNSFYIQLHLNLRNSSAQPKPAEDTEIHPFILQNVNWAQDKNSSRIWSYITTSSMSLWHRNHCHRGREATASPSTETVQVWN